MTLAGRPSEDNIPIGTIFSPQHLDYQCEHVHKATNHRLHLEGSGTKGAAGGAEGDTVFVFE